jgi:hypothetical protein
MPSLPCGTDRLIPNHTAVWESKVVLMRWPSAVVLHDYSWLGGWCAVRSRMLGCRRASAAALGGAPPHVGRERRRAEAP